MLPSESTSILSSSVSSGEPSIPGPISLPEIISLSKWRFKFFLWRTNSSGLRIKAPVGVPQIISPDSNIQWERAFIVWWGNPLFLVNCATLPSCAMQFKPFSVLAHSLLFLSNSSPQMVMFESPSAIVYCLCSPVFRFTQTRPLVSVPIHSWSLSVGFMQSRVMAPFNKGDVLVASKFSTFNVEVLNLTTPFVVAISRLPSGRDIIWYMPLMGKVDKDWLSMLYLAIPLMIPPKYKSPFLSSWIEYIFLGNSFDVSFNWGKWILSEGSIYITSNINPPAHIFPFRSSFNAKTVPLPVFGEMKCAQEWLSGA